MPELPEVETTRRGIAPVLVGRRIASVRVYDPRLRWPVPADLARRVAGRTITDIDRRGKYLLFRVGGDTLLIHLGMTGSLRVLARPLPRQRHDHVDLEVDDGSVLRYRDPRRFGAMLLVGGEGGQHPLLRDLGPEPLGGDFDAGYLHRSTRTRSVAIKLALMDARLVVGVGNIYANEALFHAQIRPTTSARRLSRQRLAMLIDAVRATLAMAIEAGGSTLRDYVDSTGQPGAFQLSCAVYGRAGEPCRSCGTAIRVQRLGGRATYWCPRCQR